jgi:hypothetical protein
MTNISIESKIEYIKKNVNMVMNVENNHFKNYIDNDLLNILYYTFFFISKLILNFFKVFK